jgi:uncharacterized lipoprotein
MRSIVILIFILFINACAKPPTAIVLSPTLIPQDQLAIANGKIDLQVTDNRNYRHVLQLNNGGEKQNLISTSQQPNLLVNETFAQQLKQQGYQLSPTAKTRMTVEIEQMLITLNQHTLKYNTNNNIVLTVIVSADDKKMTKKFSTKGQSHGPLTADIAVLERIFNQQLGDLISKVTNDPLVRQYLSQLQETEK